MEIDHGGFELGMAHVSLDDPQVDSSFEKMSGIGMSQGMNGDRLFSDFCGDLGPTEGPLDTTFGHRRGSVFCSSAVSAQGGEEEAGVAVGHPIAAEQAEGGRWERDVTILGALSPVDMDHHAGGIDIGDFQVETFMESQATGIDGGKDSEDVPVSLEDASEPKPNVAFLPSSAVKKSDPFLPRSKPSRITPIYFQTLLWVNITYPKEQRVLYEKKDKSCIYDQFERQVGINEGNFVEMVAKKYFEDHGYNVESYYYLVRNRNKREKMFGFKKICRIFSEPQVRLLIAEVESSFRSMGRRLPLEIQIYSFIMRVLEIGSLLK